MSAARLTDNLTQITRLRFVNAFLVREDDGLTLIDTTLPGGAEVLIAAADRLGAPIRRIALTHGHGDHVGSLDALRQKLGADVEVLMPGLDARIHAGENPPIEGKLAGGWPKITTVPDVRLDGGDRVGSLEVIATPGHTPGHVAFLDTRDRTLIAGDLFQSYGRVTVTNHFYWRFPLPASSTWNKALDLESAKRARALEPTLLVVGHGPATRDPGSAIDAAIARSERAQKR